MKGIFWHFFAALALTLMLVSCVKDNGNDSPSQEEPGTEEPKPDEQKPEEESKKVNLKSFLNSNVIGRRAMP